MLKAKVSLVMLIVLSALFIVGLTKFSWKAQAQIQGFGSSCVSNFFDCTKLGSNYVNLYQSVAAEDGKLKLMGSVTNTDLIAGLKNVYGETCVNKPKGTEIFVHVSCDDPSVTNRYPSQAEAICLNANDNNGFGNQIIPYFYSSNDQQVQEVNIANVQGHGISARICANNNGIQYHASESKFTGGFLNSKNWDSWGCCPDNYVFVTTTGSGLGFQVDIQNSGRCVEVPAGTTPEGEGYPKYLDSGVPKDINLDEVWPGEASAHMIADQQQYKGSTASIYGRSLGWSGDYASKSVDPLISLKQISGANKICDLSSGQGCAIIDKQAGGDQITYGGEPKAVITPDRLTSNNNLTCIACFNNGEPMTIENNKLILCDNGKTNPTPLVNNSIADTLAYINAQKNLDPQNADFIKNCTAAGGIPTAIGCIDPSPLGIITGLIRIALGVVGGIALLELILVGIQYQRGDEEGIKKARERLIATLSGVALLVFSVLILRILGVNILDVLPSGSI